MAGQKSRRRVPVSGPVPAESSVSLGVTVGWMMSALSALVADAGALFCWGLASWFPAPYLQTFKHLGLFIGATSGMLAALLLLVAYFVRSTPAPQSVIVTSCVITAVSLALAMTLA